MFLGLHRDGEPHLRGCLSSRVTKVTLAPPTRPRLLPDPRGAELLQQSHPAAPRAALWRGKPDLCSSGGPRKTPILASARGSKLVPTFRGDPASQSSNPKGLWWGTGLGGRGRGDEQRSEAVPSLSDMGSRAGSRPQLSNERVASQVTTTRHWGWEGTVNESGMLRDLHRLRSCGRGKAPGPPGSVSSFIPTPPGY